MLKNKIIFYFRRVRSMVIWLCRLTLLIVAVYFSYLLIIYQSSKVLYKGPLQKVLLNKSSSAFNILEESKKRHYTACSYFMYFPTGYSITNLYEHAVRLRVNHEADSDHLWLILSSGPKPEKIEGIFKIDTYAEVEAFKKLADNNLIAVTKKYQTPLQETTKCVTISTHFDFTIYTN